MMPFFRLFLLLLALSCGGLAHASIAFDNAPRASDEELDRMRGGFVVNLNGLEFLMAFSLEQLTYINGNLVSAIRLNPFALTPLAQFGQAVAGVASPAPAEVHAAAQGSGLPAPANDVPTPAANYAALPWDAPDDASAAPTAVPEASTPPVSPVATQTAQSSSPAEKVSSAATSSGTPANPQVITQGGLTVIQNGPGNTISLPSNIPTNALTTVIQNTLNEQIIRNVTVLNATIAAQALAAEARLNAILNQHFRRP